MAAADPRLVCITPAMREGSGLVRYAREFKNRYFDVGIAEQHAVTFAAGMACSGMKPVVAIYSTFLQRGTISSFTTWRCKICPCCSPLTGPESLAQTRPRTSALLISRT